MGSNPPRLTVFHPCLLPFPLCGSPYLISHSELESVVLLSLQEAIDVYLKPGSRCGAGQARVSASGAPALAHSHLTTYSLPLDSSWLLWEAGDKEVPPRVYPPHPGCGEGHLSLGMKGPRPLLLTSTRMTTLPFLTGMGVYQLMTHTSSALHGSAGKQGALRLLGSPCNSPCPALGHEPHWGLCGTPSRP